MSMPEAPATLKAASGGLFRGITPSSSAFAWPAKGRFVIPLSLVVLDETLGGLSDLAWLAGRFFPGAGRNRRPDGFPGPGGAHESAGLGELFRFWAESVNVLRAGGRP
ncbi:MAG: hypothetical protein GX493_00715 [Firmicutes bacterium]|nr:hypothetical protein [Bacillota bacterium]